MPHWYVKVDETNTTITWAEVDANDEVDAKNLAKDERNWWSTYVEDKDIEEVKSK